MFASARANLDEGVDGDQLRDRLGQHDRAQSGVLVEDRDAPCRNAGLQDAELASIDGEDPTQIPVEVKIRHVAEQLGEVIRPRRGRGVLRRFDVETGQAEPLVVP